LQVPNAFTPNGDGVNDVFHILGSPQINNITFCVYNKWGARIFCTSNLQDGWNGTFNGKECEIGTYAWVCSYTSIEDNKQHLQKGNVTLIR
jgi:gliding motility-associated-like protein